VISGTLKVRQAIAGPGFSTIASIGTGTCGTGTHMLNAAESVVNGTPMAGGRSIRQYAGLPDCGVRQWRGSYQTVTGVFAPGISVNAPDLYDIELGAGAAT
jgi:hypothetical protein